MKEKDIEKATSTEETRSDAEKELELCGASIAKTTDFALATYSTELSINQYKIQALAMAQITEDDKPDEIKKYIVDPVMIAEIVGSSAQSSLVRNIKIAAKNLFEQNPQIQIKQDDGILYTYVFNSIKVPKNKNYIEIEYSREFRNFLISVRNNYDFIYPASTILKCKCKYAPPLYNFLLAQISIVREQQNLFGESYFEIEVSLEEMLRILNFKTPAQSVASKLNEQAILPACSDLNRISQLEIIDGKPEYIKNGRTIIGYRFKIKVKLYQKSPLFADNIKANTFEKDFKGIPDREYIESKLLSIGVNTSFIKSVFMHYDAKSIWGAFLYTLFSRDNLEKESDMPKYFNSCMKNGYAKDLSVKELFKAEFLRPTSMLHDDIGFKIINYYGMIENEKKKHQQELFMDEDTITGNRYYRVSDEQRKATMERLAKIRSGANLDDEGNCN